MGLSLGTPCSSCVPARAICILSGYPDAVTSGGVAVDYTTNLAADRIDWTDVTHAFTLDALPSPEVRTFVRIRLRGGITDFAFGIRRDVGGQLWATEPTAGAVLISGQTLAVNDDIEIEVRRRDMTEPGETLGLYIRKNGSTIYSNAAAQAASSIEAISCDTLVEGLSGLSTSSHDSRYNYV